MIITTDSVRVTWGFDVQSLKFDTGIIDLDGIRQVEDRWEITYAEITIYEGKREDEPQVDVWGYKLRKDGARKAPGYPTKLVPPTHERQMLANRDSTWVPTMLAILEAKMLQKVKEQR